MCSNYARMCFGVSSPSSPRSKPKGRSKRHDSCAVNTSLAVEEHSTTDLLNRYSSFSKGELSATEASLNHMVEESSEDSKSEESIGNKIMVVVDSSLEAKGALEWALSHTAQTHDTILLLHLANAADTNEKFDGIRAFELLHSLKKLCQISKPGVLVEVALVEVEEGKEKGQMIVEEAKRQGVSLLVLGQERKRSTWWQLGCSGGGGEGVGEVVVEYCIQNAACMTVAVRKKNSNGGGYLISTKLHKNFWLLA
ncbi:universal stress protein PHOS32-like [Rosa sericea]